MSVNQQSFGTKSTVQKLDNSSLKKQYKILFHKDYDQQANMKSNNDEENNHKHMKKKEVEHADFIERLLIEASSNKQQRRRRRQPSVASSNNNSSHIDKLLQDETNDWFFEKILAKFENIRSKNVNQYERPISNDFVNDDISYGVERIIERRYYVKKPTLTSKRDKITSTSDLTGYKKKNRQHSGVSSITAASTMCSQCSSSTPTYVENLRDQSDTLRNEISDLKHEIEQLQTSQQEFFQKLQINFQSKSDLTTLTQNLHTPTSSSIRLPSEKTESFGNLPVPLPTGQKSRSISTASQESSSSSEQTVTTLESTAKPNAKLSSIPVAPLPLISEFMATKNPSIASPPPTDAYVSSKTSSIASASTVTEQISSKPPLKAPTTLFNRQINSKQPSIASTTPVNGQINSKPPSIAPASPVNEQINSKPSSIAPTPTVNGLINSKPSSIAPTSPVNGQINSRTSSIASTPTPTVNELINSKPTPIAPSALLTEFNPFKNPVTVQTPPAALPMGPVYSRTSSVATASSARVPIYENEVAYRRVLSPRSQIVASSVSIPDSSDSSSGSVSPELIAPIPQKILKAPATPLRGNDLNDLVRYSSQLSLTGFPPSINPVISNPNTNSTFWDSVDRYIENVKSTNINIGLPPIPRSNNGNRFILNNNNNNYNTTRQLDKYDLEIKPQEFIESTAPFLMPPLDSLP